jgi:hypothetical protein
VCLSGSRLDAQTHVIIVTGASGESQYATSFASAASSLFDALVKRFGFSADDITYLAEEPARDPARIDGRAGKQELTRAIAQAGASKGDRVLIVLIGHGSHAGNDSRFNLPGPDLTASELGIMLEPLKSKQVAVVNTSSASGDFVAALSARNRIIITSTKSSYERNETIFPQHFVAAFASAGADTDKDEAVSLLEAFTFAKREVQRAYESGSRLPTEHAMLDDDGDHRGSSDPDPRTGDGAVARRFAIGGRTATASAATNNADASLVTRKEQLESQIDALRRRKETMAADAYDRELERLLVDLARVNQEIRGGKSR